MVPSEVGSIKDTYRDKRYFNPAIIPLPSFVSSSPTNTYNYLVISRLVTSGIHQESHVCFADICTASHSSFYQQSCTDEDLALLGSHGGLRCVTQPEKVNIPPTPAKRCNDAWRVFPDIPGFHDPRVFWSGKGEPLIEVNSGSMYGCVGLWLQDLRAVFPPLEGILKETRLERKDGDEETESLHAVLTHRILSTARMGFPRLTELTRNPREARGEVEKNWIIFFPNEDEMWAQYDLMVKFGDGGGKERQHTPRAPSTRDRTNTSTERLISASSDATRMLMNSAAILVDLEFGKRQTNQDIGSEDRRPKIGHISMPSMTSDNGHPIFNATHILAKPSSVKLSSISPKASPTASKFIDMASGEGVKVLRQPLQSSVHAHSSNSPGRTVSQLISHGFSTQNLTSPLEPPCFDLASDLHVHDSFNNTGHWHQGSNSLRVVLCSRAQFRSRTCIPDPSDPVLADASKLSWRHYEEFLKREGAILHFSIIHRKFTNDWDLPMRYERYVLAWEARRPFRIVAVSEHPLVFGTERARPWSIEEDVAWHSTNDTGWGSTEGDGQKQERREKIEESTAYFTYTPSIAWSWRPKDEDGAAHRDRGHEDLGTGYLGEEVIAGVGMDDIAQGYVQVRVDELLECMRLCPGVA